VKYHYNNDLEDHSRSSEMIQFIGYTLYPVRNMSLTRENLDL